MKKLSTFLFSILLISAADAQVEIRNYTGTGGTQVGNDISGTVFSVTVDQTGTLFQHFAVKNVSGTDLYLGIRRLRIDVPVDWTDQLSWAQDPDINFEGSCYTSGQMSSNPWTSANAIGTDHFPTIQDQNIGNLTIEINVQSNGAGYYRYYILDQSSAPIDSVDLQINAPTLGVIPLNQGVKVDIYPNPANANLTINTTFEDDVVMKLTDLVGNEVYNQRTVTTNIDVSACSDGVYLLSVFRKDELFQTQRIVIEH